MKIFRTKSINVIHIIRVSLHLLDHIEIVIAKASNFAYSTSLNPPKVTKNFHAFALQERLNAISLLRFEDIESLYSTSTP